MQTLFFTLLFLVAALLPVAPGAFDATEEEGLLAPLLPHSNERVPCMTNGSEGKRIVAVYTYPAGKRDNYSTYSKEIRKTLSAIDGVWDAAADPSDQHPRWSCDPATSFPRILRFRAPAIGSEHENSFGEIVYALRKAGYTSTNRIYLIFADHIAGVYDLGGAATVDDDDRPDSGNLNNTGPAYAMIDAAEKGWSWAHMWRSAMHELGHALGAVQCSAPHSTCGPGETGHHHCWDEYDLMCYDDGGSYFDGRDGIAETSDDRSMAVRCDARSSTAAQWDCGKNDYFNIRPVAGSYLATHWNVARSGFVTPRRAE